MDITEVGYIKDSQENPQYCPLCGSELDDNDVCLDIGNEKCINAVRIRED